ncbi:MAG: hypothetical protein CL917_07275 [Deltaproteobacteria bacterium]|nr:hypothetical protein [Deltaproteobacteria bacterium]
MLWTQRLQATHLYTRSKEIGGQRSYILNQGPVDSLFSRCKSIAPYFELRLSFKSFNPEFLIGLRRNSKILKSFLPETFSLKTIHGYRPSSQLRLK